MTLFGKNDRVGGLLRYGIPDFKARQRATSTSACASSVAEGVHQIRTGACSWAAKDGLGQNGKDHQLVPPRPSRPRSCRPIRRRAAHRRRRAEPRPARGQDLAGIHFAMGSCRSRTRSTRATKLKGPDSGRWQARHRHRQRRHRQRLRGRESNRHGAKSVTQFEVMPMPPEQENKLLVWPCTRLNTQADAEDRATGK